MKKKAALKTGKKTVAPAKPKKSKAALHKSTRDSFLSLLKEKKVSESITAAFASVDQSLFFDKMFKDHLYGEQPVPIMYGQKSDPFLLLARMIHYLDPKKTQRILEIGTGSGYSTAVLSLLCREVVTIDINEKIAQSAKNRLYEHDFGNIRFFAGDGTLLEDDFGTVDGVIIHAACRKRPFTVMKNLVIDGTLVFPMGPAHLQQIVVMQNAPDTEKGINFKIRFCEQGVFSLIQGPFGYDNVVLPKEFFEAPDEAEMEPPKTLESNTFLFQPTDDQSAE